MNTEELMQKIPESIRELITTHQTHKIAKERLGLDDVSFEGAVQHLGMKIAERQMRWRPVMEGLKALKALQEK